MRYTTERQLREAGYGEEDVADLRRLRTEGERYIRREQGGSAFQPVIDEYAGQPWFPLAFIPREVPETPEPWEMDFDPATLLGQITCPVLAVYGDDDRWVPIDPSIAVFSALPRLEIVRISGGGHAPTTDREGGGEVLPQYRDALAGSLTGPCFAELLLAGAVLGLALTAGGALRLAVAPDRAGYIYGQVGGPVGRNPSVVEKGSPA